MATSAAVSGPYFDDLENRFRSSTSRAINDADRGAPRGARIKGLSATVFRLALDAQLAYAVNRGDNGRWAHPALVLRWSRSGQSSTLGHGSGSRPTFFYRGLDISAGSPSSATACSPAPKWSG